MLLREKLNEILDPVTNNEMNNNQTSMNISEPYKLLRRFQYPSNPNPLTTNDYKEIGKVVNYYSAPIYSSRIINFYLSQLKKQEEELNAEILKKFGDKFSK